MPVTILQSWKKSWDNFMRMLRFFEHHTPSRLLMSHTTLTLCVGCRNLLPRFAQCVTVGYTKEARCKRQAAFKTIFYSRSERKLKAFTFTGFHVRFKPVSGQTRATIRSRCVVANVLTRVASWETFVYICVVQKLKLIVCVQRSQQLSAGDRPGKWKTEALWGLQMS